jgi:hypothetical protein
LDARDFSRKLIAFWTIPRLLGAGAAVALAGFAYRYIGRNDLTLTTIWCATMLVSFVGWGEVVNHFLAPERRADWGLRAAWGMGVFIFVGGIFCALKVTSRRLLVAQVLVGVLVYVVRRLMCVSKPLRPRAFLVALANAGPLVAMTLAFGIAAMCVVGLVGWQQYNPNDDQPLYFLLIQKLLQQGSLYDPFDVRRISTFGGHLYLQAAYVAVVPYYCLNAFDPGLFTLVLLGLVAGHFTSRGLKPSDVVPMGAGFVLVLFLISVRANTASLFSGASAYFAIYRTLHFPAPGAGDGPRWPIEPRLAIVLALMVATCIGLRTSNAIPSCTFMLVLFGASYLSGQKKPLSVDSLRTLFDAGVVFLVGFVLFMLPWMIELKRSCGTFFYPLLGNGWISPGFVFLKRVETIREASDALVDNVFYDRPIANFGLFLIAGLALMPGRWRFDLVAMTIGTLVGGFILIMMGYQFGALSVSRYYFAYLVANVLAVVVSIGRRRRGPAAPFGWARDALVLGALAYHVGAARDLTKTRFTEYVKSAEKAYNDGPIDMNAWNEKNKAYTALQSRMDPGTKVVVAVLEPFRFDCARNLILSLDFPGGMGPHGFPGFQGPEALERYLHAQGIRYLVYVDFSRPNELYNKGHWQHMSTWTGSYLAGEAPFVLDAEINIERLAERKAKIYQGADMTVLDLEQPAAPARASGSD